MKTVFFLAFFSLTTTAFAETAACLVNKKYKGSGTLSERVSQDGKHINVVLTVEIRDVDEDGVSMYDRWSGFVARRDLAGNLVNVDLKQEHRFALRVSQKVAAKKLAFEYFNPGMRKLKSQVALSEDKDFATIKVNETIYDDYQRVEGRNSVECRF